MSDGRRRAATSQKAQWLANPKASLRSPSKTASVEVSLRMTRSRQGLGRDGAGGEKPPACVVIYIITYGFSAREEECSTARPGSRALVLAARPQ